MDLVGGALQWTYWLEQAVEDWPVLVSFTGVPNLLTLGQGIAIFKVPIQELSFSLAVMINTHITKLIFIMFLVNLPTFVALLGCQLDMPESLLEAGQPGFGSKKETRRVIIVCAMCTHACDLLPPGSPLSPP